MKRLDQYWYSRNAVTAWLRPVSWAFCALVWLRRLVYRSGIVAAKRFSVPVIVIGNITVGGTGKTPLVIWMVRLLKKRGFRPGVVARGYRGQARSWPQQVRPDSDPVMVGDEALLLARHCGCPVAVGPNRVAAVDALLKYNDCDLIVADDGLQHYALRRDIEIAVVDGVRRFGNGLCLPAGPLRERATRLKEVDLVVANGGSVMRREYSMAMTPRRIRNVRNERQSYAPGDFPFRQIHAVAGIGNPARFFGLLKQLGFSIQEHAFIDHHAFRPQEIAFDDERPVVMTEKDAVKCRRFCHDDCWYLEIEAQPDERLQTRVLDLLEKVTADTRGEPR